MHSIRMFFKLIFIQPGSMHVRNAQGRMASPLQQSCFGFFEKITSGFFQSRLRHDRTQRGVYTGTGLTAYRRKSAAVSLYD